MAIERLKSFCRGSFSPVMSVAVRSREAMGVDVMLTSVDRIWPTFWNHPPASAQPERVMS